MAFVGAAVALMLVGKIETVVVEELRMRATDAITPILDFLSRPVAGFAGAVESLDELASLRSENARLREENERLIHWQLLARRLEGENQSLRDLLRLKPGPPARHIAARVVADTGGAFARSVLVNAGTLDGVRQKQSVLSSEGLVGRVVQVGRRSARVLLITDLNSRVPVVVGDRRLHAILSGTNGDRPVLRYFVGDDTVADGDFVMTSGQGGMFPPGLPIGTVARASAESDDAAEVVPLIDWHRLEFVRIVDFSGGLVSESGALR
ncbi:rod shape-determining protein MreC [Constrictibacter sp. MBR-5]|jgi:rod shape-determining protein MreC|uniref:rod shape-determining protein MreC n=1 Tax=Constrictibacter sp. MBR-5 TaxID=3156467 RepID=UPI003398ADF3